MELELFRGNVPDTQTPWASRDGILEMQKILEESPIAQGADSPDFPLVHRFADNVYAREIFLPRDSVVVGKIHRFGHLNVITKGHVSVLTEFGVEELRAPCTFISKPGTKRVVYAHEDTVWTTFHGINPSENENVDAVEERIICKTYSEYDRLLQLEEKP